MHQKWSKLDPISAINNFCINFMNQIMFWTLFQPSLHSVYNCAGFDNNRNLPRSNILEKCTEIFEATLKHEMDYPCSLTMIPNEALSTLQNILFPCYTSVIPSYSHAFWPRKYIYTWYIYLLILMFIISL